jgi:large subunit ribosomal protein L25
MESNKLQAAPRNMLGKQKVKKLKAQGYLPAVIYGRGIEPTPLQVSTEAVQALLKSAGYNALVELAIDGGSAPVTAIIKKIQRSPITQEILNVDFHQVAMTDRVHARVTLEFVGTPTGVSVGGGTLLKPASDLEIIAPAGSIPTSITADVSNLGLDQALHVRDLPLPEGVEAAVSGDEVVAIVHPPHGAAAAAEAEEGAEGAEA